MPTLPVDYKQALDRLADKLPRLLGGNLYSCIVYGSAVRGNVVRGHSDINFLIILNESTPEAHSAIADCLDGKVKVDLFIIGRRGMERSFQAFAIKFRSIARNYRLLYGTDPFQELSISDERLRFICEQSLRNLRLRCVHNYIFLRHKPQQYAYYLRKTYAAVFIDISEVLRLEKVEFATDFSQRIAIIEKHFAVDASILQRLLELKSNGERLSKDQIPAIHGNLFNLLHHVITWVEAQWPTPQ
ncbi:MAG: nucleotidyltransferase domain-containing protein [Gammaproteobacteria bacterium]|nr:nucleotidyltransferase domain-containing protein [Gammaproteobacteria bacterium]MDH5801446.1 nucleotidyltransferase domain-containing protein [Gammaproteobacteria bacterium]